MSAIHPHPNQIDFGWGISHGQLNTQNKSLNTSIEKNTSNAESDFSAILNLSTDVASEYAKNLASGIDLAHVDLNLETQTATYLGGEPITSESQTLFAKQATNIAAGRVAIYQADVSSGKSPQQTIIDIINYMNSQSPEYLQLTNWEHAENFYKGK